MRSVVVIALTLLGMRAALGQDHQAGHLGLVRFANSCDAGVQPGFSSGMALLHSFEFGPAIDAFNVVAGQDRTCGIALWGIALAQWGNPFSIALRPAAQLQAGAASIDRAKAMGVRTARERGYIDAVSALYDNADTVDQRTRMIRYRDGMARLVASYPDDPEASVFYALSLAAAADPADKTYADQVKAGSILERLWRSQPQHPGLAHYIIHSYDVPALAARAVDAARRYAQIAPDAPHALHMPSHTFTRLGYWQESIDTNILSAAAAQKAGETFEALHASDYAVYAYLQTAQDAAAKRLVDAAPVIGAHANVTAGAAPPASGSYALAAIPARYALERGAWADAAHLVPQTGRAYTEAVTSFARALGAARAGDAAAARSGISELESDIERLTQEKESYWVEQVTIQKLAASGWLALAEGRSADALRLLGEAADREDRTEKAPISPGPLAPAHELLGEMLLQVNRPKDALVEFRQTMAKEPNRFRGIAGAAKAAAQAGDDAAARTYYRQLLAICQKADAPGRADLQAARAATSRIP